MSRIFQTQNQFIIRFPESIAAQLQAYFQNPDNTKMPEIDLDLDRERRDHHSRVGLKVGVSGQSFKATVMELPTISSTFKTIDRVNFFKSNDVSEMIVVHENEDETENIYRDMAEKVMDKEQRRTMKYNCESGVTPPTKYIRQQNFKDKPEIEKTKVAEVDYEMEKIRFAGSQQRQREKTENKEKKSRTK